MQPLWVCQIWKKVKFCEQMLHLTFYCTLQHQDSWMMVNQLHVLWTVKWDQVFVCKYWHLCSSLVMRSACNEHSIWEDRMSGHAASQNPHTLIHTPYFQYSLVFLGCCRLAIYDSPMALWDWPFSNISNCFISLCVIFLDIRLGVRKDFSGICSTVKSQLLKWLFVLPL